MASRFNLYKISMIFTIFLIVLFSDYLLTSTVNGLTEVKFDAKRFKRETDHSFDENGHTISDYVESSKESTEETIEEEGYITSKMKQIGESISNMWNSVTESLKNAMSAFRGLFNNDDSYMYELYDDDNDPLIKNMEDNEIFE